MIFIISIFLNEGYIRAILGGDMLFLEMIIDRSAVIMGYKHVMSM